MGAAPAVCAVRSRACASPLPSAAPSRLALPPSPPPPVGDVFPPRQRGRAPQPDFRGPDRSRSSATSSGLPPRLVEHCGTTSHVADVLPSEGYLWLTATLITTPRSRKRVFEPVEPTRTFRLGPRAPISQECAAFAGQGSVAGRGTSSTHLEATTGPPRPEG